jgi:DNA polymerase-3 subunit alpha
LTYINLHGHSAYSFLDGLGTPEQRAQRAVEINQPALAISDHGVLAGIPDHIRACQKYNLKPIVGIETYFKEDRSLKDKEHGDTFHLLLIAQNEEGWRNLLKLSSEAHISGFYKKPCVDWELLEKYNKSVICSSACVGGYLPQLILKRESHKVADCIEKHLEIFGDRYYFELMPHDSYEQREVNIALVNLSRKYGDVPLLATNDSHYTIPEWSKTQRVATMMSVKTSFKKREEEREKRLKAGKDENEYLYLEGDTFHMMNGGNLLEAFEKYHSDLPRPIVDTAIYNSYKIAQQRTEAFDLDSSDKLPKLYPGKTEWHDGEVSLSESFNRLQQMCDYRLQKLEKAHDTEYIDRLRYELKVINTQGVSDYILLVAEMVQAAKEKGIRVSSGRGSAAGSLVCYTAGITAIDPIAHDLLFERFMNPDRKGMPDIDIDFQSDRRHEVKEWLADRIGHDKVADIAAISTFKSRSSIKEVCRVFDVPFVESNNFTKTVDDKVSLTDQEDAPEIQQFIKKYPEIWHHAKIVENSPRLVSTHAAGVVVSDRPITDYMPLMKGKEGLVTSWTDRADYQVITDILKCLKIDVLSTDGLTKQHRAIELIKERQGIDIDLDALSVATNPDDADDRILSLYRRGLTLGLWQFSPRGITNFLKRIKSDRFQDLVAANALYRPGPLEGGDAFEYADRKRGKRFGYWHPSVEPYLEDTYGILAYQEQMMKIVSGLGNFTSGEADDMRKATSKLYRMGTEKAKEYMRDYENKFLDGCTEKGISMDMAQNIWNKILAFGGYSFNRAHSTSYSYQSYQDGYLKVNYPLEFYAALLSIEDERFGDIIREAKEVGIDVLPPDVNESDTEFTITDQLLRYGLVTINHVGRQVCTEIIKHRPYANIHEFHDKTSSSIINIRVYEYLWKGGAFDSIATQGDLLEVFPTELDRFPERESTENKRKYESEALGIALSGLGDSSSYKHLIEDRVNTTEEFDRMPNKHDIMIGGEITDVNVITTKKGAKMAFSEVIFGSDSWELTVFPQQFAKYEDIIKPGNVILAKGKKSVYNEQSSVALEFMVTADELEDKIKNR